MHTDTRVFVIAEAGVNHNGDLELAKQLIVAAAEAGADAVKFQTFRADQLLTRGAAKADYQTRTTDRGESQFEMIRKLELTESDHTALIDHARMRGIAFLSSPFDVPSVRLLTERLGLRLLKIPSGEITNAPLLLAIARAAQRVILSTGMSTVADVQAALSVLAFGFTAPVMATPEAGDFDKAFASEAGMHALRLRVTLLHCTTEYPAPVGEVNLLAMDSLAARFALPVGYSDHTQGFHVSLAAVARGARVIEKHFTLDRELPGPDHSASLEPNELRKMVLQIRDIEAALGDGDKRPTGSERKNLDVARKSLVAARAIRAGEVFAEENLAVKRPGGGASPFEYWRLLGQTAKRSYEADEAVDA